MIKGIDISNYQSGLNFSVAKNMGFEICIIKATESTKFTNSKLDEQVAAALNSGMKVGFYHFFKNNGVAEANYFLSKINPYISKMTIKPVIDIESAYSYKEVIDFINTVEEKLSVECVIYCNYSYCKELRKNSEIAKRTLWLAYYGKNDGNYYVAPNDLGFAKFAGQQYSDKNHIGNINVDMNFFNENMLLSKRIIESTNNSFEKDTNTILAKRTKNSDGTYTVKSGDTLSEIARDFGMNYQELAKINGISNPNVISVGMKLKLEENPVINTTKVNELNKLVYYTVVYGDTLSEIAVKYKTTTAKLVSLNKLKNANLIYAGQILRVK